MDRRLLACFCFILIGCSPPPPGFHDDKYKELISEPVSEQELTAVFRLGDVDAVVYGLNEIKQTWPNDHLVEVIMCAIEQCVDLDPSWDLEALNDPLVRVNMIDILVQAGHNGHPGVDVETLQQDAVGYLRDTDEWVQQRALMVLGFTGDSNNFPIIVEFIEGTNNLTTYRTGMISLFNMQHAGGKEAALDLYERSSDRKRQHVADLIEKHN